MALALVCYPCRAGRILERQLKTLGCFLLLAVISLTIRSLMAQTPANGVLRVRQTTVVDEKGTERIWMGAPVPAPTVDGKRVKRSGPVSGIILLDAKGTNAVAT